MPPNLFPIRAVMGCCQLLYDGENSVLLDTGLAGENLELLAASAEKIRRLRPHWILPFHFDFLDGELYRRRFVKWYGLEDWA